MTATPMMHPIPNTSSESDLELRLRAIAESIEVPDSAYEQAAERYQSVSEWLCKDGSPLQPFKPRIYPQGSFGLGTVTKPWKKRDYDIDAVVQLEGGVTKWTPKELKKALGDRLRANGKYKDMLGLEGRRCWTLEYADQEPGFHMDLLPSVLHTEGAEVAGRTATAIMITNRLTLTSYEWRESDPKGYAAWFRKRMEAERKRLLEKRASIEQVPEYAVRTSLQATVQLLKRHRDVMFDGDDNAPISIIITTLAARAYQGDANLADSVRKITKGMRAHIEWVGGNPFIRNPVRSEENFADRWVDSPGRQPAFFKWLDDVEVFVDVVERARPEDLEGLLAGALGESTANVAVRKYAAMRRSGTAMRMLADASPSTAKTVTNSAIVQAPSAPALPELWRGAFHRQPLRWTERADGTRLRITARVTGGLGARLGAFQDGEPLPVGARLRFETGFDPKTNEELYWQIVNTGKAAERSGQLRGRFEYGSSAKTESTRFPGDHFIECFLIRDGICAARSGPFTVRVR